MITGRDTLWWTFLAVFVPFSLAGVCWVFEKAFNTLAPFEVGWAGYPAAFSLSHTRTHTHTHTRTHARTHARMHAHTQCQSVPETLAEWGLGACAVQVSSRHAVAAAGRHHSQACAATARCVSLLAHACRLHCSC